jgi:hypothetical protein
MADTKVTVDYEDERFGQVESDKNQALTEHEQLYAGMIGNVDDFYNKQIEASQQWADKQSQLQQEQTDFTIEQIEQQKDKAHKDYLKEQSGAYVDWQKQSNAYGNKAEQMASAGLTTTGFSESSQVGMYNTYQNRVATAREVFVQASLNYDNAIKDARLQNNAVLAEIAYEALQQQLELSLQGFQYKNDLLLQQANKKLEIENTYYNRYLDVLNQINTENAMAEEIRQFNESQKFQAEQAQLNRDFEAQQAEITRAFQEQQAELNRKHELAVLDAKTKAEKELLDKQHAQAMAKLKKQQEYDLEQLEKQKQIQIDIMKEQFNLQNAPKGTINGGSNTTYKNSTGRGQSAIYATEGSITGGSNKQISTAYYQGSLNQDANKYGTFSNGYQPKGISGHGTLSKSGHTIEVSTQVKYGVDKGKKQVLVQTVWVATDGTLWYWEGRDNEYKQINQYDIKKGKV